MADWSAATGGRRRGSETGAGLVEFALVLPVLMALVLGIVTGGRAYNQKISLTHTAREATRYGATLPVDNYAAYSTPTDPDGAMKQWLTEVTNVVVSSAGGELPATADGRDICVAYVYPDGDTLTTGTVDPMDRTMMRVETTGPATYTAGTPCFTDGLPSNERRVQVKVRRSAKLEVIFFTSTLTLTSTGVTKFEAVASP